jgi:hypothetical protein
MMVGIIRKNEISASPVAMRWMSCAMSEKKTIAVVTASIAMVLKLAATVIAPSPMTRDKNGMISSIGEYPLVVLLVYMLSPS